MTQSSAPESETGVENGFYRIAVTMKDRDEDVTGYVKLELVRLTPEEGSV